VGNRRATFVLLTAFVSVFAAPPAEADDFAATRAHMGIRFSAYRVADLQVTPIDFGSILINGQSGRVDMDSNGSVSFSGGVVQVSGFSQAGTLTLDGDGVIATIALDPRVDMGDGVTYTPTASTSNVQLTGKPETVYIYGTINLPAGIRTNEYHGVLNIRVTYN
jgi:hypothetical protein